MARKTTDQPELTNLLMTVTKDKRAQVFLKELLQRYMTWAAAEKERARQVLIGDSLRAHARSWWFLWFRIFIVTGVGVMGYLKLLDPCTFSSLVALIVGTFFGDVTRR